MSCKKTIALLLATMLVMLSGCTSSRTAQQANPTDSWLVPPSSLATPYAEQTLVDPGRSLPPEYQSREYKNDRGAVTDRVQDAIPANPFGSAASQPFNGQIQSPTEPLGAPAFAPASRTTRPTTLNGGHRDSAGEFPTGNNPLRSATNNSPATYEDSTYASSNRPAAPMTAQLTEAPLIRGQYTQNTINNGLNAWNGYVPNPATGPVNAPPVTYGAPSAVPQGYGMPSGGYTATPYAAAPYAAPAQSPVQQPGGVRTLIDRWGRVFPRISGPFEPQRTPVAPLAGPNPSLIGNAEFTDIVVNVEETQTGRFQVGAAVNSDAGVTGQIVIDEKNFDWRNVPESFDDFANGSAFRGGGQGFRIEAMPGSIVQRYMLQFTNPYVFNRPISMSLSAFLFDRQFFDWDEQRLGGRLNYGYRVTPDLSLSAGLRGERVTISDPRLTQSVLDDTGTVVDTVAIPQLQDVVGSHNLFSGRLQLIQDTRDIAFAPTQGAYFSASIEQVFGSFSYTRGEFDLRRYFLLSERPDGSGRHVLGFSNQLSISGSDTPIFENFFAGGYQTLRGFDFRGASPQINGVTTGGRFSFLGSVEYLFPITADDMVKGVAFVDYGTVEENVEINGDNYRVAPGLGLRIAIPALGPAPLALDFAVPVARADTDDIRQFSFYMGLSR